MRISEKALKRIGDGDRPVGPAPPFSVVIVTYNAAGFIRPTLDSVLVQTTTPMNVFVIDNASTDDTTKIVAEYGSRVSVVCLPVNVGFGAANNVGIARALSAGAVFVMLLNQDAVLDKRAMDALLCAAGREPRYGLLGAFQLTYDGRGVDRAFTLPEGLIADYRIGKTKHVYPTEFIPAVAVLLRADALFDVGGFDPLFFMYHEDQDLCRRLRMSGWCIGVVPGATVRHWNGSTHAPRSWRWESNWAYSDAVLHLKWSPRLFPLAYLTLLKVWLTSGRVGLRTTAARLVAWINCVARCGVILRHRREVPVRF